MNIHGFIDESYSGDQNSGLFTLTCLYVRPENVWWFETAWRKEIDKINQNLLAKGRQPIKRFHATELNGGTGQFAGWHTDERVAFAKKLIGVIANHTSSHMAFTMDLADLKAVWPENNDDPFSFAFNVIMKLLMLEIGEAFKQSEFQEKIDYIIERGPGAEQILAAYNSLMAELDFKYKGVFNSIRKGDWQSDTMLQVADLFCYEAYKDAVRRGKNSNKARISMEVLLELGSVGIRTHGITREAIAEIKANYENAQKQNH